MAKLLLGPNKYPLPYESLWKIYVLGPGSIPGESEPRAQVPRSRALWTFEPNPHAHLPPRDCYSGAT
jgi:hypothetical protein